MLDLRVTALDSSLRCAPLGMTPTHTSQPQGEKAKCGRGKERSVLQGKGAERTAFDPAGVCVFCLLRTRNRHEDYPMSKREDFL